MFQFPNLNPQQLRQLAQSNIMSMYNYVEGQNFARNTPNQYLTQVKYYKRFIQEL